MHRRMPLLTFAPSRPVLGAVALLAALLAGCSVPQHRAPVEERRGAPVRTAPAATPGGAAAPSAAGETAKPLPGAENAGKPGYYTVKAGDTLIRIALEHGQPWRELVRWNTLDNPNQIEVGQVLRVVPPGADPNSAASRPVASSRVDARPLDARPVPPSGTAAIGVPAAPAAAATAATAPGSATGTASAPATAPTAASTPAPAPEATPGAGKDEDVNWAWPSSAPVAGGFVEGKSKGLVFTGKAGDPVLAAADGRVVYAGSDLRGYGNLVIVKHNNTYLTAYAHNQALLVKEDQVVRRGQRIADMGAVDAERVQLHFEIRRQGKPVDPARFLPGR